MIPLALTILGSLATSGLGGGIVSSITSMLGGPKAESVADKVIAAAEQIFGTKDPKQIELAIQQDKSKAEIALKQMDKDLEEYRLQVEDTSSARERDVELRKLSGGVNIRANVMLIMAFSSLLSCLVILAWFRKDIPDGVLAIMNMTIGALLAMLGQAFNFEFGSSRSSGEKTDQLASMMSNMKTK